MVAGLEKYRQHVGAAWTLIITNEEFPFHKKMPEWAFFCQAE